MKTKIDIVVRVGEGEDKLVLRHFLQADPSNKLNKSVAANLNKLIKTLKLKKRDLLK